MFKQSFKIHLFIFIFFLLFSCNYDSSDKTESETIKKTQFYFNIDTINPNKVKAQDSEPIVIKLPNEKEITLIERKINIRKNGYTFYGYIKGNPNSNVILTVQNKYMYGKLTIGKEKFYIEPEKNGLFLIAKHLPNRVPSFVSDIKTISPKFTGKQSLYAQNVSDMENGSRIDILVLYTQKMKEKYGERINALIQNFVDITNDILQRSGVSTRLNLVGIELYSNDNVQESIDIDSALYYLKNDPYVSSLRRQYNADLVNLVRVFDSRLHTYCGVGYILSDLDRYIPDWEDNPKSAANIYKNWAYSVIQVRPIVEANPMYCLETTFAHEIGHNLGANHDRNHSVGYGAFPYSYGHDIPGLFATIMSYDQPVIEYYSTPNVTYKGEPIGIPEGLQNSANNVKTFNKTKLIVSNYYYNPEIQEPDIDSNKTLVDFRKVSTNDSKTLNIIIRNIGNKDLILNKILIRGKDNNNYSLQTTCPQVLEPDESCKIFVTFSSTDSGYKKGIIKIYSNDPDEPKYYIKLRGIAYSDREPDISSSFSIIRFGEVPVGTSAMDSVIIENMGNKTLFLNKILLKGKNNYDYSINNNCPLLLEPNKTCKINIIFHPTDSGYKKGVIKIYSNDPDEPKYYIKLRGIGI